MDEQKIKVTQDLPIVENVEIEKGFFYSGQTPTLCGSFVGRLQSEFGLEEGEYVHNVKQTSGIGMNGFGRGFTQDRYYEGEYKKGKCDGSGKIVFPDGATFKGLWKNHQFLG